MTRTHFGQHGDECFGCRVQSINIQGIGSAGRRSQDSTFAKDMDAYKRLRHNGVQPKQIGGSAEVEAQASTKFEIEHRVIMSPQVRKEFLPKLADQGAK